MEIQKNKYEERQYILSKVAAFKKTHEVNGGLSNMCSGYPLIVNEINILTSEALYQACRFPDLPDVQKDIIIQKSPMAAKMKSKPFRDKSRPDWEENKVKIMKWCLQVKLAQNFTTFGLLLEKTFPKAIVENSHKDAFWGAIIDKNNPDLLIGVNALGRLLMDLREQYISENRYNLLYVEPLNIPNFKLYGKDIEPVDERLNFVNNLRKNWKFQVKI